jgi:hypothetical protein
MDYPFLIAMECFGLPKTPMPQPMEEKVTGMGLKFKLLKKLIVNTGAKFF